MLSDIEELAQQFVDEDLFVNIADRLSCCLDYNVIAYDLGMDYFDASINAQNYIYRTG